MSTLIGKNKLTLTEILLVTRIKVNTNTFSVTKVKYGAMGRFQGTKYHISDQHIRSWYFIAHVAKALIRLCRCSGWSVTLLYFCNKFKGPKQRGLYVKIQESKSETTPLKFKDLGSTHSTLRKSHPQGSHEYNKSHLVQRLFIFFMLSNEHEISTAHID